MNQKEQTDNYLSAESASSMTPNTPSQSKEGEVVYIAELDGEFFTVDYDREDDPKITPLKVREIVRDSALTSPQGSQSGGQLASLEEKDQSAMESFTPEAKPIAKAPKRRLSENKSLALGIGIGLAVAWGATKFLGGNAPSETAVSNVPAAVAPSSSRTVTVTEVANGAVDKSLEVSGTVEALELIPVTSQAMGLQIVEVLADEGQTVNKGQLLARLKSDTVQAEYAQAQAAVQAAEARLAELQAGSRSEEVEQARERVRQANAVLEQAKSDLDLTSKRVQRNRSLETQGAISRDRLDEIINQERVARAAVAQAEASLSEANQALRQLETGARPEVISQAKAELAQAKGQLQFATVQLNNAQITAPANGTIAERNAKVGDITANNQTLFSIIEDGNLELRLQVPETDLSRISTGQKVAITTNQGNTILGEVREIDPIIDSASRQATVKVDLPANTSLQPGMFLEAAITTSRDEATTVPIKALLPQTDNRAIAFVLQDDNQVASRTVTMGEIVGGDRVEILEGLEAGEQIVVKGAAYLKDGDTVKVSGN